MEVLGVTRVEEEVADKVKRVVDMEEENKAVEVHVLNMEEENKGVEDLLIVYMENMRVQRSRSLSTWRR